MKGWIEVEEAEKLENLKREFDQMAKNGEFRGFPEIVKTVQFLYRMDKILAAEERIWKVWIIEKIIDCVGFLFCNYMKAMIFAKKAMIGILYYFRW
jgi:hypothetical protein